MQLPLEITFRNMDPSPALEDNIRDKASKLERYCDRIMSCRVAVEAQHKHHHKGNIYHCRIDLTVPGKELAVSREPHKDHSHEDPYVAVRDSFDAMRRQLEAFSRQKRGEVKTHQGHPMGQVSELVPEQDFGRIGTVDGRDIYFHRNSVVNGDFNVLRLGQPVTFVEEEGDEGPQASAVMVEGSPQPPE